MSEGMHNTQSFVVITEHTDGPASSATVGADMDMMPETSHEAAVDLSGLAMEKHSSSSEAFVMVVATGDLGGPSASKRGKAKAPVCVTSVRHSTRSNKYDGFKIPSMTDTKAKTYKVKPRVIPNANSVVVLSKITDDSTAEPVPPPTPIAVMQMIGTQNCAIP